MLARQLRKYSEENSAENHLIKFSGWLLEKLQCILREATNVTSTSLDQCTLWSKIHQLRCSDDFHQNWKSFLLASKLNYSTLFYQTVTTRFLDFILKDSFPIYSEPPSESANEPPQFTYEEKCAIRYVGGSIVRQLKKDMQKDDDVIVALMDLVDEDCEEEPEESEEWIGIIDRGGLIYINNATYNLLCSMEYALRRELNIHNAHKMDDSNRAKLKELVESDDEVQFNWTMASVDMDDDIAENIIGLIIKKWITIRGFSFASSVLEMYKLAVKQGTQKSKRLRHNVAQN